MFDLGRALLAARRGLVLAKYAAEHEVPLSTLYRDLDALRDAGFPIESRNGRHWLRADFQLLGRAGLDADELLALHTARSLASRLPGTQLERALASVWQKLAGLQPQPSLLSLEPASLRLSAFPSIDYRPFGSIIATIEDAIHQRTCVRLRYRRAKTDETTERVIEPGELYADAGAEGLYCIAWCQLRGGVRVFAVHRMLGAEPTTERFKRRPETRSRVALRNAFRVWHGETVVRVRLRFRGAAAREIAERRWHPSQILTPIADDAVLLELHVTDSASLDRWLLGFGADVHVIEPESLAARVRDSHVAAVGPTHGFGAVRRSRAESFSDTGKPPSSAPRVAATLSNKKARSS